MCPDTKALLAYVKLELFLADICYYIKINPKPITAMAKKIAEQLIDTLVESGVERIYAVTGDSLNEVNEAVRKNNKIQWIHVRHCLLYTSPSPRDQRGSRMPSSA